MLRDVHAAPFHPLPERKQALFSGRLAMGLDPITGKPRGEDAAGARERRSA